MILRPSGENAPTTRGGSVPRRTDVPRAVRQEPPAVLAATPREVPPPPHRLAAGQPSRKWVSPPPPSHLEPVRDGPRHSLPDAELAPFTTAAEIPAQGIQLAGDVRLPAAIMALAELAKPTAAPIPPAVVTAQREIVAKFYQEVAASVPTPNISPGVDESSEEIQTTTVVIPPSESVNDARHRADEQYRTLFGDAAYNRQIIGSAIEVRLPEVPGGEALESPESSSQSDGGR